MASLHTKLDRVSLLAEAYRRTLGRKEVQRALQKGGSVKSEVEQCLGAAFRCVESLCEPGGQICEVSTEKVANGVRLGRDTVIHSVKMRDELTRGAKAYVYLATCGYDSQKALRWLDGDYSIYHFQNMIGRELLYSIGRHQYHNTRVDFPQYHFARYAVKMRNECFGDNATEAISLMPDYWDARKVISLLDCFDKGALGVFATDSGCLSPVHSLLGVMMGVPVIGHQ